MLFETKGLRIFLYKESVDMRAGFEKLLYFVRDIMKNNINQGHLYLFFGKNRKRMKALFYDGSGLVLISKRIERGRFMSRLELGDECEINLHELKQIFNGGVIVHPKVERSFFIEQKQKAFLPEGNRAISLS